VKKKKIIKLFSEEIINSLLVTHNLQKNTSKEKEREDKNKLKKNIF